VVFHFLEPHRALVRKQLPAFVDCHFRRDIGHRRLRSAAPQGGGEFEQIAQVFERHQRFDILIGPARADWLVGGVMRDQR
jgi:hypothetical protein